MAQTDSIATAILPTDVYAYYVVVTPGNTFTSMLGHAAIRMQCPSAGLDYCFTVKSPEIGNEFTAMTLRTLQAGLVPEKTEQFFHDYVQEGRGISEYKLKLTLNEVRTLWQLLDEEVGLGLHRNLDYIHHGCAQEAFTILSAAIRHRNIDFDAAANRLLPYENRRQILARYKGADDWMGFIGHSLYGGSPDEPVRGTAKLIMPMDVAQVLNAERLTEGEHVIALPKLVMSKPLITPLVLAVMFLLLCLLPLQCRVCNAMLLMSHFLISILMVWLVFVSKTPGTEWNWLIIPFNPIPTLTIRWAGHRTYMFYAVVLSAMLVFMLLHLGHLFFTEQIFIVAGLLMRTIYHSFNINLFKNKRQ